MNKLDLRLFIYNQPQHQLHQLHQPLTITKMSLTHSIYCQPFYLFKCWLGLVVSGKCWLHLQVTLHSVIPEIGEHSRLCHLGMQSVIQAHSASYHHWDGK